MVDFEVYCPPHLDADMMTFIWTSFFQVTSHISSISDIYVHDGAIGSSSKYDAKVRVISDSPSAALSLSNVLWKTSARAVSHDSWPLTVYVASSLRFVNSHPFSSFHVNGNPTILFGLFVVVWLQVIALGIFSFLTKPESGLKAFNIL